jgi:hypothetical protein
MNNAEAINDTEFTMKAASYPKRAAVTPPRAAPSVNCKNRVENMSTFADNSSREATRLGTAAFFPASKKVEQDDVSAAHT